MRTYKGVTGAARAKSLSTAKQMRIERGLPLTPPACQWCGQTNGILQWHNPDYSHPIDNSIGLCWRCHMMHHSEWISAAKVREYMDMVRDGYQWPPIFKTDFGILARDHGIKHPRKQTKPAAGEIQLPRKRSE